MEEETTREGGSTLGDIFRVIFSQKWVALAVAAVLTIVCAVSLYFGYNKAKKYYTVSFELELAGSDSEEQHVHKYPDGVTFNYRDIISRGNLEYVKGENAAFSSINVDKLSENGAISISRSINRLSEASYETVYSISVKASYFGGSGVARDFLMALAATPDRYLASMNIDYNVYLTTAATAIDYRTEIGDLIKQVTYVSEQYDALIKAYGDVTVTNGKTLSAYKQSIDSYLEDRKVLANLLTVAEEGLYLKSDELKDKYEYDLKQLATEYDKADATLQNLLKSDSASDPNATVIKEQSDLVQDLKRQKDLLQKYITGGVSGTSIPESFISALSDAHTAVAGYTDEFKTVSAAVYGKSSSVTFTTAKILQTAGGMGVMKIAVLSLALGVIAALIVAYAVGIIIKNRRTEKAAAPSDGSAEEAKTED